jgi:hypothetical protein
MEPKLSAPPAPKEPTLGKKQRQAADARTADVGSDWETDLRGPVDDARDRPIALDLSCPDWRQRLADGRPLVRVQIINSGEGERAARIFNRLRLADVPGTPTMAEAGGDWFRDIVRALFGSLDPLTRRA